jgi:diguanylate cyclase (GGDEF)-like protein
MHERPIKVLLIEDNPGDVRLIKEHLADLGDVLIEIEWAAQLGKGLERLSQTADTEPDLVLLDLALPDSHWQRTLDAVQQHAPLVPVIVLTGMEDEAMATLAVQRGAQDYLIKGEVDARTLERAIRYAVERHRAMTELQTMSLTDELTGLHNRRGFATLATQQVAVASRAGTSMMLMFSDLDGLKWVNDNLGHGEGDELLKEAAEILAETFRKSDVIARVGGDEFAVLAVGARPGSGRALLARLRARIEEHNDRPGRRYRVSMSVGTSYFDPDAPRSLDDLMAEADAMMYDQKRRRKQSLGHQPAAPQIEADPQG